MRLSARGCYEISGTVVRHVTDAARVGDTEATWEEQRGDLLDESSAIAHVRHTLTAEENGLWNAIQRELAAVDALIARGKRNGGRQWPAAERWSPVQSASRPATCPLCHTADSATTDANVAAGGSWRCRRCGQRWSADRLATFS